jgi:hypothetical protein
MSLRSMGFLSAFAVGALAWAHVARAGGGAIEGGKVDLSVMFGYDESDPDAWRPLFEEGSRLLFNATNGQLQLGRVRVLSCGFDNERSDVWILDGDFGAFANILGLGGDGHIYLSQTHKSTSEPALGQFGLVHELGHYAFGLYDEYDGVTQAGRFADAPAEQTKAFVAPNQFCTTDADVTACIMDGGTTVSPNHLRTEFCTRAADHLSTRHNEGVVVGGLRYVNWQELINEESCWETMAASAGLVPPDDVQTGDPAGLEPIEWEVVEGVDRVVVCIDHSGSMSHRWLGLAKAAGKGVVDLLHAEKTVVLDSTEVTLAGEELGIVSFAARETVDFPMREVTDEDARDAALAAIDAIPRTGAATNVGAGLEAALHEIETQSETPACSEAIVLITDGHHNTGTDPMTVLPAIVDRGVRVYSVGIGTNVGAGLLGALADSTGGEFFQLATAEDLVDVTADIAAAVRAAIQAGRQGGATSGEFQDFAILIDRLSEDVTNILDWDEGTLDLLLISPSGDEIDVESAEAREDVEAVRRGDHLYIRVVNPEDGTWTARVMPVEIDGTSHFLLTTIAEARGVSVTASTDRDVYPFPVPIRLRVSVVAGVPVAGAEVTALVERPLGDPIAITAYDDGVSSHGDEFAGDGVYGAVFAELSGAGAYTFHVTAVNETGTGPSSDLPFVEDGADPASVLIPPFVRETRVDVLVGDDDVPGTFRFHPNSLNAQSHGQWVTGEIELETPFDAGDIVVSTVRLEDVVPADPEHVSLGDDDGDGASELTLKFDRGAVIDLLPLGMAVPVRVTGLVTSGERFEAYDTIRVFDPPTMANVTVDPDSVSMGGTAHLGWPDLSVGLARYSGFVSADAGRTWEPMFEDVMGRTTFDWLADLGPADSAMVIVEARTIEGVSGMGISEPFVIADGPVRVPEAPPSTAFLGVSPHPVRGSARFEFSLAASADVRLDVYDVVGRRVRKLGAAAMGAGPHVVAWDGMDGAGRPVSSGVYLYVFEAGGIRRTGRITVVR